MGFSLFDYYLSQLCVTSTRTNSRVDLAWLCADEAIQTMGFMYEEEHPSPASEDSRPPENPFIYVSKETEPHSPCFSTEMKTTDDELLRVESDTEARSSFMPDSLPDSYQERLKLLDLEMTSDTRLNKVF